MPSRVDITTASTHSPWRPDAWREVDPHAHQFTYEDPAELDEASARLRRLPPLVTSWEIEHLKELIADAQEGKRFLLQGGDCAETLEDCSSGVIADKLKILLQMALVLASAGHRPVIRVGRFAGQYTKPRSSASETREVNGQAITLPSYFGDMINAGAFDAASRRPDPWRMVIAHQHAAMTLNFIRSLCDAGFADLHHPENWDLRFFDHASLTAQMRERYERMSRELASALRFMEALGERSVDALSRTRFYTSHEGLNLHYEAAMTRRVPRRDGWYNLSTHMPWIGERTRSLTGAHARFFAGIRNPVGVKLGPSTDPVELLRLLDLLNPANEAGKIVLIARMGAQRIGETLPRLAEVVRSAGKRVLWISDPMHGNGMTTTGGIKTRNFDAILAELQTAYDTLASCWPTGLGGVHFELTGEDVTECVGGASGVGEDDLSLRYASLCDPRLNYQQSLELAFLLAEKMRAEGSPNR